MDELQLLIDLHKDGARQGPGGDDETRLAVRLSGLKGVADLEIADIGRGTGGIAADGAVDECQRGELPVVDDASGQLEAVAVGDHEVADRQVSARIDDLRTGFFNKIDQKRISA